MELKSNILIIGPQRSATTKTFRMLHNLYGVKAFTEGFVLNILADLHESCAETQNFLHGPAKGLDNFGFYRLDLMNMKKEFTQSVLQKMREESNGQFFIDKTPGPLGVKRLRTILNLIPNTKVIFIKRNGLECVKSSMLRFPKMPFFKFCQYWNDTVRQYYVVRNNMDANFLELEHADYKHQPRAVAQSLVQYLELPEAAVDKIEESIKRVDTERSKQGQTMTTKDVKLTPEQEAVFRQTCGLTMRLMGYPF